jgi:hypothetical protein
VIWRWRFLLSRSHSFKNVLSVDLQGRWSPFMRLVFDGSCRVAAMAHYASVRISMLGADHFDGAHHIMVARLYVGDSLMTFLGCTSPRCIGE